MALAAASIAEADLGRLQVGGYLGRRRVPRRLADERGGPAQTQLPGSLDSYQLGKRKLVRAESVVQRPPERIGPGSVDRGKRPVKSRAVEDHRFSVDEAQDHLAVADPPPVVPGVSQVELDSSGELGDGPADVHRPGRLAGRNAFNQLYAR